ncbi:MAG: insulinase family protein [candidate division WOR-3 bacterium]|nr:insulinase family protein [candidate division WOR-3 bacterium]
MRNHIKTLTEEHKIKRPQRIILRNFRYVLGLWFLIFNFLPALPISRDSLNTGLKVLSYQTDRLPLIEMRWVCYAGSVYDPANKSGLANLTTKLLTKGTRTRSAITINKQLEFVGASLTEICGYDYSALHLRCLKKDLDLMLDILADILTNPEFPESELNRLKKQTIGELKQYLDYPYNIGWQKFVELIFQDHPYCHSPIGDTVSVANITRQDVIDFYRKYWTIDNSFLVVAGDFDKTELLQKIQEKFRNMKTGKADKKIPEFSFKPFSEKPKGYLIHKPELNQSYIFIGHSGIAETSPDYFPSRVMNYILGGSPLTSRIGAGVRETQGLAYDARSFFDRRLYGGLFVATTQTSDPNKAINIILNELKKMKELGATAKELNDAKTFYIGNFPFNYDATRDKIELLQSIELYQKGLDYPTRFNDYIQRITLDEVNQMARKYLLPENYLLVIVSNLTKEQLKIPNIDWLN